MFANENPFSSPDSSAKIRKSRTVTASGSRSGKKAGIDSKFMRMPTTFGSIEEENLRKAFTTMDAAKKQRKEGAPGDNYVRFFGDLIQPQHRMEKNELIQAFKTVLEMDARIKDPKDELQSIARKITKWKRTAGEIDAQLRMVNKALKKKAGQKIKVQNFVTVSDKLEELGQINLTRDEKHLLIFSSMMDEEINNLVISNTKFLDWFQIDFADDT